MYMEGLEMSTIIYSGRMAAAGISAVRMAAVAMDRAAADHMVAVVEAVTDRVAVVSRMVAAVTARVAVAMGIINRPDLHIVRRIAYALCNRSSFRADTCWSLMRAYGIRPYNINARLFSIQI